MSEVTESADTAEEPPPKKKTKKAKKLKKLCTHSITKTSIKN